MTALAAPALTQSRRSAPPDASDRPQIDVESYAVEITIAPEERQLQGSADIQFRQLDRNGFATFDLDRRLRVTAVTIGGASARFRQFDLDSTLEVDLTGQQFAANPVIHIEYSGILDAEDDRREPVLARITEESAFLLYDGKWFPMNGLYKDKAAMRLRVHAPQGWTVVTDLTQSGNEYASSTPSYWGMVAAGNYTSVDAGSGGAPLTVHTIQAKSESATALAETAGKILNYYRETFGPAPAPHFRIVEVHGANWKSPRWSAGSLVIPSSQFRADFDAAALARTLAHQWFPLKVAVANPAEDAWLVDGMAVFASLLYFEKNASPAEAQEQIDKALVKALGYEGNTSIRQAGGLERDSPEYHSLVEYKAGFVLRMLRWVIGDEKFNELLVRYLQQFESKPASTEAFVQLTNKIAGEDLTYFFDQWVYSSGVPEFQDDWQVNRTRSGYSVVGQIKQDLDLFRMPVELEIQTDGDPDYKRVEVVGPSSEFEVSTERRPKLLVIDPRKKILRMSPDIRVAVLINRGEELANEGRYAEAVDEYQKAIDLDDNNSLAYFRMGEALFEAGNLNSANLQFQAALNGDLKPKWVEVWSYINRGKIYDIRSQRERAVSEYQKAVNTGDDSYGAQAEAQKYLNEPFRKSER